jgi:DNA polymerase-3 subunit chi
MKKIVFVQVKNTAVKLLKIHEIAASYFQKQDPLLILVHDAAALEFLDTLLWRYPEEGFLPHGTSSQDVIMLSTTVNPLAKTVLNLCQTPVPLQEGLQLIYELEDDSSLHKKQASEARYQAYRQAGCAISSQI